MSIHRYAVMGYPIAHSLSPNIHHLFAQETNRHLLYERLLVEGDKFEHDVQAFFKQEGAGLNITQPYKVRAFNMCDVASPRARQAGCANTLWMSNGQLHADNTDGIGLLNGLKQYMTLKNKRILVIGAGGAVRGIVMPLLQAKAHVTLVNRTYDKALLLQQELHETVDIIPFESSSLLQKVGAFDVVINATSASLHGEVIDFPREWLRDFPFCYDLTYHASGVTPFVTWAIDAGCVAYDGLSMLIEQAAEAFFIWHGVRPTTSTIASILRHDE